MKTKRTVKLSETLWNLIEARGYSRARKKICSAVGISPSALTQYLQGQARPSFDKLLSLAEFFDVGLDYLVYGDRETVAGPVDYGPVVRYIDMALSDLQTKSDQHAMMFTRIARVLAEQIDVAARDVAENALTGAGLLAEDETMLLEAYSLESWIGCMNLQTDIKASPDKPAIGRFLLTVARNLSQSRRYHFLLPATGEDWKGMVSIYLQLLQQHSGDEKLTLENCKFKVSRLPMFAGSGLYRLHASKLATEQPILYERIRPAISDDDWVGYLSPPSNELHADALMDAFHLKQARRAFDKLWRAGDPV